MIRSYKQITFWENDERIKYLKNFNSHVVNYFNNIGHDSVGDSWEKELAKIERKELNKLIDKAHSYIIATGVSTQIIYYPAPITGREPHYTDLVINIFNLIDMYIDHSPLLDSIEKAIARYENDKKVAVLRTWCPFFGSSYLSIGLLVYLLNFSVNLVFTKTSLKLLLVEDFLNFYFL